MVNFDDRSAVHARVVFLADFWFLLELAPSSGSVVISHRIKIHKNSRSWDFIAKDGREAVEIKRVR